MSGRASTSEARGGPLESRTRRRTAGFSYAEVLLAAMLIAIALVPALDGISVGLKGGEVQQAAVEEHYHVLGRLEEVLAEPFESLDAAGLAAGDETTPSSYSDPSATPRRRLVFLARYDGDDADGDADPFTGGDTGLLWVRVELENSARFMQSLTSW